MRGSQQARQNLEELENIYLAANKKGKTKKKARDGQFGGAVTEQSEATEDEDCAPGTTPPVTLDDLEGCFDSLAAAAVTGNDVLEQLVKSNTTLTKTKYELSATVAKQAEEIKTLLATAKNKRANGGGGGNGKKKEAKYCPNCKRDTWHDADDCFELPKNADKRPKSWKSVYSK